MQRLYRRESAVEKKNKKEYNERAGVIAIRLFGRSELLQKSTRGSRAVNKHSGDNYSFNLLCNWH